MRIRRSGGKSSLVGEQVGMTKTYAGVTGKGDNFLGRILSRQYSKFIVGCVLNGFGCDLDKGEECRW